MTIRRRALPPGAAPRGGVFGDRTRATSAAPDVEQSFGLSYPDGLLPWGDASENVSEEGDPNIIFSWLDKVKSHEIEADDAGAGTRPTLDPVTGIGSEPAIHFDGADDFAVINGDLYTEVSEYTIFVAFDGPDVSAARRLIDFSNGSLSASVLALNFAGGTGRMGYIQNAGTAQTFGLAATGTQILTYVFSESAPGMRKNGVALVPDGSPSYTPQTLSFAAVGARFDGGAVRFGGDLGQILVYTRVLSEAECLVVEQHFMDLYGIT